MKIIEHKDGLKVDVMINNIVCGDCLSIMRQMPDRCIDLIVTSPPYNLLMTAKGKRISGFACGKWKAARLAQGYDNHGDDMPYGEYVSWQRQCLTEFVRLIKEDGAIFYNNKNRVQNGLLEDRGWDIVRGFPCRQIITWKRSGAINFCSGHFLPVTEQIYLICHQKFKLAQGANRYTDVWEITQELNNPHPAPFPKRLVDRIIKSTSAKLVLDPFAGSGTTGVAAIENNRNFILIEKSQTYCEMALNRIKNATAKPTLQVSKNKPQLEF